MMGILEDQRPQRGVLHLYSCHQGTFFSGI